MSILKVNKIQDTTGDDALTFDSSGNTTVNQTLTTTLANITTGGTNSLTISDGDLVIGTSGHGISFTATSDGPTMANELFDDYEEGTFDVTFNGNVSAQSGANKVQYVKVGRLVTLSGQVHLEASNNTDNVEVNNLPFASSSNLGESTGEQYVLGGDYELNHQSDTTGVRFYLTSASQVAKLIDMRDNAGYAQVPAAPSKYVFLSMTYICQT